MILALLGLARAARTPRERQRNNRPAHEKCRAPQPACSIDLGAFRHHPIVSDDPADCNRAGQLNWDFTSQTNSRSSLRSARHLGSLAA